MKLSPISYLAITTLILITVTIFAAMGMPFNWVFYTMVVGQGLLIFSVIKVLKDQYTTNKSFKDFYEDNPIKGREDLLKMHYTTD